MPSKSHGVYYLFPWRLRNNNNHNHNDNNKQLVIIDTAAAPALYVVSQWAILQFFSQCPGRAFVLLQACFSYVNDHVHGLGSM